MSSVEAPIRDRLIRRLSQLMDAERIAILKYDQVATMHPETRYVEARPTIAPDGKGSVIAVDEAVAILLEDYLNAQPPGRPFLDFRPDMGSYLFPDCFPLYAKGRNSSPRTGLALSVWSVRQVLKGKPCKRKRYKDTTVTHDTKTTCGLKATTVSGASPTLLAKVGSGTVGHLQRCCHHPERHPRRADCF